MTDSPPTALAATLSNLIDAVPLPDTVQQDDTYQTNNLRAQIVSKRISFPFFPRKRRSNKLNDDERRRSSLQSLIDSPPDQEEASNMPFVRLSDAIVYSAALENDYSKDVYQWAILYENQRGVTLFSTPYYSYLSLLPTDPPPFTVFSPSNSTRRNQPTVSLDSYTLPDGTWQWVSREWMVDMRGEGQTQYDGFEYNWLFQRKRWRAEVGTLSAGGWVRRRRWVRLMMRPALKNSLLEQGSVTPTPHMLFQNIMHLEHNEAGMTRPPSVASSEPSAEVEDEEIFDLIWQGDPQADWDRCHAVLTKLGTDGRQLELWHLWLNIHPHDKGKQRDEGPLSSEVVDDLIPHSSGTPVENIHAVPDKRHVAEVLRCNAREILNLFIYPDSRTQFLELAEAAGLLSDLRAGLGSSEPSQVLDFYSSLQSFHDSLATGSERVP